MRVYMCVCICAEATHLPLKASDVMSDPVNCQLGLCLNLLVVHFGRIHLGLLVCVCE